MNKILDKLCEIYCFVDDFLKQLSWKDNNGEKPVNFCVNGENFYLQEGDKTTKNFNSVVTGMTFISSNGNTSLFDVPSILILKDYLPNYSFASKLSNVQKLNDEKVDGYLCYQVMGEISGTVTEGKAIFTFWIDKESFLIRRIDRALIGGNEALPISNRTERYNEIEVK